MPDYIKVLQQVIERVDRKASVKVINQKFDLFPEQNRWIKAEAVKWETLRKICKFNFPFLAIYFNKYFLFLDLTKHYENLCAFCKTSPFLAYLEVKAWKIIYNYNIIYAFKDTNLSTNITSQTVDSIGKIVKFGLDLDVYIEWIRITRYEANIGIEPKPHPFLIKKGFLTHRVYDAPKSLMLSFIHPFLDLIKKIAQQNDFKFEYSKPISTKDEFLNVCAVEFVNPILKKLGMNEIKLGNDTQENIKNTLKSLKSLAKM